MYLNLKGIYHPRVAYSQSKLANVYMANEIGRRDGAQGLHESVSILEVSELGCREPARCSI
jgi:hypothetical protein